MPKRGDFVKKKGGGGGGGGGDVWKRTLSKLIYIKI